MFPTVSIIIPCRNERATIHLLLDALLEQTYPRDRMEVVIADGMSDDGTPEVIRAFHSQHPDLVVRLISNPDRAIPHALNRAISASQGDIIVRIDAHAHPYPDYVARCVAALERGEGENVGGIWEIHPGGAGCMAKSIAVAAGHPIAVGDARYRHATTASYVDTVAFGAFRRSLINRIGPFDETLLTNEDYEFNARVRQSGGRVWLDPNIRMVYYARASLPALIRQYWRYGYWKWRMLRRYPSTLRWRQALPPAFLLSLIALMVIGLLFPPSWLALCAVIAIYLGVLIAFGLREAVRRRSLCLLYGLPVTIAAMHITWASGFLWSVTSSLAQKPSH